MRPAQPRLRRRGVIALVTVALIAVGLIGAYSYWEAYYQHRGFATVAFLPHAQRGHLQTVHFYSPALHRVADYILYTPPGYDQASPHGARSPVYYLLHGSPGRPVVFTDIAQLPVRMDNLIAQHRMRPMILVFPDGRIGASTYSDSEWANTPSGHFASYVLNVVHDVDHRFRTLPHRDDRVIAGFSAGAYGATNIALHNVRTFANLQSWSGYYTETRTGGFAGSGAARPEARLPLRGAPRRRQPPDGAYGRRAGRRRGRRHLGALSRRPRLAALARPPGPDAAPRLARHRHPAAQALGRGGALADAGRRPHPQRRGSPPPSRDRT